MKKQFTFVVTLLSTFLLVACGAGNTTASSSTKKSGTSSSSSSTSRGPIKNVSNLEISLGNSGDKAYITVTGTQNNYTADEFKWAWGLKASNGNFDDGKANPAAEDFQPATFDANNAFTVRYCLTDIQTIRAGTLYRIYGGTPETYGDIAFQSNMFGANDATRKYYLRVDESNSLVFENVQPLTYDRASIVELAQADLPDGVTQTGAYLKFGGNNSKNLTVDTINEWHTACNIAGDFQRINPSWDTHAHVDAERFWTIEGNYVYFYLYVGFIQPGEGWMTHFDLVSGNAGAGLQLSTTIWGETAYEIGGQTYRIYADTSKGSEENYWGCVGVYKEAAQA